MESIIQARLRQRISGVYDTAHGAQGTAKAVGEYTRSLEKAGKINDRAGTASDFLRDFGGGI